jgi:hypothetical protein
MLYIYIATKTTVPVVVPPNARSQLEMNRRISNSLMANSGGHLTVGDLKLRPVAKAIPNHLLCDGSAIARTQFPELFALLGTTFGAGDGSTTFNLPDYSGSLEAAADGVQTITERGTVEDPLPVTEPTGSGQTGGTVGGNVVSGGVPWKIGE